jgi:cytochrome c
MTRLRFPLAALAALALATAGSPAQAAGAAKAPAQTPAKDQAMRQLANQSGCMSCHHIEPGAKSPNGMAPIGPAWQDIAAKYQGQKDAANKLTQTVLAGSNPYNSHWAGKVSGLAMPANAIAIQPADAKRLVGWILMLAPAAKP